MATKGTVRARLIVLVVMSAVVPYLNALHTGFTLDDEPQIRKNPAVTHGIDLVRTLASPLYPGDLYRPFTVLTFAINERVSPGNPAPFHAVNILLHVAVTFLVLLFARQLFDSEQIGLVAAAFFAVHPIHTEAVTSLVGRAEVLAALFGLLALLSAARVDTTATRALRLLFRAASIICFSLAVLSKESGLTLLPLIVVFRIVCRREPLVHGLWREIRGLDWIPYVLCAALFLALRFYVVDAVTAADTVTPLDNVLAFVPAMMRLRSALGILWDYFGLLNFPLVLAADYSHAQVPVVTSWTDPRFLAGLALVVLALGVFLRQRQPAISLAAVLPLVALSVTSNILVPIGTVKAERLLYFASVGWVLLIAYGFDYYLRQHRYQRIAAGVLAIMLAAFAARVWIRNWDWTDNLTLYASMARGAPDSAKARYNYGIALQQKGLNAAAVAQFERALALYPWTDGAALGIGIVCEKAGRIDEAVSWYERALVLQPDFGKAHTNLCHVLFSNDRFEAAAAACRNGLRYEPADANLLKGLGASLVATGASEKGVAILRRSLALNGHDDELRTYLAKLETPAATGGVNTVSVQ